jgi:cytidylate kinase
MKAKGRLSEVLGLMGIPEIIAIDGPAASGKSTLGKRLANDLDYLYFDTGVMYRAITWLAIQRGVSLEDENAVTEMAESVKIDVRPPTREDGRDYDVLVEGEDITWEIRRPEVDANVSVVSTYPGVRRALSAQQRRIGLRGHVVMVGRDIGTVVLPEAELKIYLDASVEERAKRRYQERLDRGELPDFGTILKGMRKRDQIDSTREIAPLRPAETAVILDSDGMNAEEIFHRAKSLVQGKR